MWHRISRLTQGLLWHWSPSLMTWGVLSALLMMKMMWLNSFMSFMSLDSSFEVESSFSFSRDLIVKHAKKLKEKESIPKNDDNWFRCHNRQRFVCLSKRPSLSLKVSSCRTLFSCQFLFLTGKRTVERRWTVFPLTVEMDAVSSTTGEMTVVVSCREQWGLCLHTHFSRESLSRQQGFLLYSLCPSFVLEASFL
jgi:hypothetical protein